MQARDYIDRPDWQAVRRIINAVALFACAAKLQERQEKANKPRNWRTWQ